MHVVVFAGGIGGARFLRGLRAALDGDRDDGPVDAGGGDTTAGGGGDTGGDRAEITAVVNTGDDVTLHGLRICPDLDTVMYTLGGGIDPERGWGRVDETWVVKDELAAYGIESTWFGLGDRDLATHLVRTQMLDAGYPLSAVTEALCDRWRPGVRILPMTDTRVETHVVVDLPAEPASTGPTRSAESAGSAESTGSVGSVGSVGSAGAHASAGAEAPLTRRAIHFQEWWIRHRAEVPARSFVSVGMDDAKPAPGVLEALAGADLVILAPSNPVVSVGPILAVPGIRDALRTGRAPVVGLSPIIGGAPVRGMADACLTAIGVETSAEAVGRHYGARTADGVLDGWLVDTVDSGTQVPGVRVAAVPLLMSDLDATAAMARAAMRLVLEEA